LFEIANILKYLDFTHGNINPSNILIELKNEKSSTEFELYLTGL